MLLFLVNCQPQTGYRFFGGLTHFVFPIEAKAFWFAAIAFMGMSIGNPTVRCPVICMSATYPEYVVPTSVYEFGECGYNNVARKRQIVFVFLMQGSSAVEKVSALFQDLQEPRIFQFFR